MDEALNKALDEKTDIIVDSAMEQLIGLPVKDAEMVMIKVSEDLLCMAMSRLNKVGIEKMLYLISQNIRWRLEEVHKEK